MHQGESDLHDRSEALSGGPTIRAFAAQQQFLESAEAAVAGQQVSGPGVCCRGGLGRDGYVVRTDRVPLGSEEGRGWWRWGELGIAEQQECITALLSLVC
jgi:hypothetical protein